LKFIISVYRKISQRLVTYFSVHFQNFDFSAKFVESISIWQEVRSRFCY